MKHWRIIAALSLLIGVSSAFGGWIGWKCAQVKPVSRRHETWHKKEFRELSARLHFSPDQERRMQPSIDQAVEQLRALRERTLAEERAIMETLLGKLEAEMTETQRHGFKRPPPRYIRLELLYVDSTD